MNLSGLLIGDGVRRRLESALGHLSHAYIISGPAGSAVGELADLLAAAYVCTGEGDRPCGVCSGCRKAKGKIHPDIIRLSIPEGKREILVEQARQLRAQAYVRPNEAACKVFIIENAQTMNNYAQNALLKVLEEGPDYLAVLFLTEHPEQLLGTIRSRCEHLSLIPEQETVQGEVDEEIRQMAAELAYLLAHGDERSLMEYAVGIETKKWSRDSLLILLEEVETVLRREVQKTPAKMLPLMEHFKQVQQAAAFNVGTGHLLGWLAAKK